MGGWPRARTVELERDVAGGVASAFGLGDLHDVALAARGWVSLNVTWRLTTSSGLWAVKEVARESREELDAAAQIEEAAGHLGIASPLVIRTVTGNITATLGGRVFRCHEFLHGECPVDDLRRTDAAAAGEALARLHAAALPFDPILLPQVMFGEEHWRRLITQGQRLAAPWTPTLSAALAHILRAEEEASHWRRRGHRWIGSHRDVRPDNSLRVADQLVLVDWDGAGPVVQGREVAGALKWWRPHDDAFIGAYTDVVGEVDLTEGAGEDGGLVWWLETNVRHALALPGDEEREWAVSALAANFQSTR